MRHLRQIIVQLQDYIHCCRADLVEFTLAIEDEVVVFRAIALILLCYCVTLCVCNESNEKFLRENAKKSGVVELPSGLQYKVVKSVKSGLSPNRTSNCHVHYRGHDSGKGGV